MKNINNDIVKQNGQLDPKSHPFDANPDSPTPPAARPENLAEAALNLAASKVLEALRDLDWARWKRQMLGRSDNLEKLIKIAACLSRESLAYEKFRTEMATIEAKRNKRAPTLEEIEEIERKLNLL